MCKRYLPFLAATLFIVPLAAAQPSSLALDREHRTEPTPSASGPASVLYAQYSGGNGLGWYLSENYEEANDAFDSYLADDFEVPPGDLWDVTGTTIVLFYSVEEGGSFVQAPTFNVILWSNGAGQPGSEVARFDAVVPTSDSGAPDQLGEVVIDLPTPVQLAPGTYWLTVQANQDFSANGTRFLWYSTAIEHGERAQVYNYGGGRDIGSCTTDWGPVGSVECGRDGTGDPSLYFRIIGDNLTVENEGTANVQGLALGRNYPNPSASYTEIPFSLGRTQRVRVAVFDVLGREVLVAADRVFAAGSRAVEIDVSALPNGLYIYRMVAGDRSLARRMIVAR